MIAEILLACEIRSSSAERERVTLPKGKNYSTMYNNFSQTMPPSKVSHLYHGWMVVFTGYMLWVILLVFFKHHGLKFPQAKCGGSKMTNFLYISPSKLD